MDKSEIKTLRAKADSLQPPYSPAALTTIRKSFGLSGPQFARLLSRRGAEIHRNTWRKWERGENEMSPPAQCLVAMILHMRRHAPVALLEWMSEGE